jgi:hypothetical protein
MGLIDTCGLCEVSIFAISQIFILTPRHFHDDLSCPGFMCKIKLPKWRA